MSSPFVAVEKNHTVSALTDLGPERDDLRPKRGLSGLRGDLRIYKRIFGNSHLCPTGHRPFEAAAHKLMVPSYSLLDCHAY